MGDMSACGARAPNDGADAAWHPPQLGSPAPQGPQVAMAQVGGSGGKSCRVGIGSVPVSGLGFRMVRLCVSGFWILGQRLRISGFGFGMLPETLAQFGVPRLSNKGSSGDSGPAGGGCSGGGGGCSGGSGGGGLGTGAGWPDQLAGAATGDGDGGGGSSGW